MKYFVIEIKRIGGRLRAFAYLTENDRHFAELGEWWIESRDHVRYKPFKPMHPKVYALVSRLPREELEKLGLFLMTAREGEKYAIPLEKIFHT